MTGPAAASGNGGARRTERAYSPGTLPPPGGTGALS